MHKKLIRLSAFAAGAVFVLAGCGGGSASKSSATSGSTSTTTAANAAAGQTAFRDCLEKQGVELPAGFGNGGGGPGAGAAPPEGGLPEGGPPDGSTPGSLPAGDRDKLQKAMQACGGSAPAGGFGNGGGANPEALKAYTSCLSDHGVQVPTTTSGSTPTRPGGELGALRSDPKFAAANKVCMALLPAAGSSTTTTVPK